MPGVTPGITFSLLIVYYVMIVMGDFSVISLKSADGTKMELCVVAGESWPSSSWNARGLLPLTSYEIRPKRRRKLCVAQPVALLITRYT